MESSSCGLQGQDVMGFTCVAQGASSWTSKVTPQQWDLARVLHPTEGQALKPIHALNHPRLPSVLTHSISKPSWNVSHELGTLIPLAKTPQSVGGGRLRLSHRTEMKKTGPTGATQSRATLFICDCLWIHITFRATVLLRRIWEVLQK